MNYYQKLKIWEYKNSNNSQNINAREGWINLKSTGITRRIDDLGRIVIPKEIRKNLKIKENEVLEIFINNDEIILKPYLLKEDN